MVMVRPMVRAIMDEPRVCVRLIVMLRLAARLRLSSDLNQGFRMWAINLKLYQMECALDVRLTTTLVLHRWWVHRERGWFDDYRHVLQIS